LPKDASDIKKVYHKKSLPIGERIQGCSKSYPPGSEVAELMGERRLIENVREGEGE
jgi:hypothetical protein